MQVFDETTNRWVDQHDCVKIVIQVLPNQIIYGYTSKPEATVRFYCEINNWPPIYSITIPSVFKGTLLFSKADGYYFSPENMPSDTIEKKVMYKGQGEFPYLLFRSYEAINNFYAFENKQILKDTRTIYPLSNYLNYTIGLEFETSQGYIPEDKCYTDGLIPLRDGSITAPEYSTVILKGNKGISLLHQQLETLQEYTNFNKDCSLHIHFGGFPLNPKKIFNLYNICYYLQNNDLSIIVPTYTFESYKYKSNGKNYCKRLKKYYSFNEMYQHLVKRSFFGDLTQPHPADLNRCRKWQILTRYYCVNFINMLCYNVNKTVEFRFLRPTYNFNKIILWIYIFNAILIYAEKYYTGDFPNLYSILEKCYPKNISLELEKGIKRLQMLTHLQENNGDFIGAEFWRENDFFNDLKY